jgi:DNA polymerase V
VRPEVRADWYARLPVDEVWGIGRKTTGKLKAAGVETLADFVALDLRAVRDSLTVVGGPGCRWN